MSTALFVLGHLATKTLLRKVVLAPAVFRLQNQVRNNHIDFTKIKVQDLDESQLTDFEISKDPKEWKYVERVLPLKFIPIPPKYNNPSPSGWKSPKEEAKNLPYFVPRNRSHLQPVHLNLSHRNERKLTVIKRIQGDIWQMEKDLRKYLESKSKTFLKFVPTQVNEFSAKIIIHGDHVAHVKAWMDTKGF